MRLIRLTVANLRCLQSVSLQLHGRLTLFTGANGAGKTSLLEAVHLLGYGRSFRGRVRDGLIRTGAEAVEVFAEWEGGTDRRVHRAGLRHGGRSWEARLDGASVPALGELCAAFPVVSFEPGSHELIAGGAEHRRRFLDWGLFHVEQGFLGVWRRYARALKQRNALLKQRPAVSALIPWDHELADAGEALTRMRGAYLDALLPVLGSVTRDFLPELGEAGLEFQPGWRRAELSLADALTLNQERDLMLGYTAVGPHRADWRVGYERLPGREALSRGQEKLTALACVLAQAEDVASRTGDWPLVCLDDLPSELDREHQSRALERLTRPGAHLLLTATEFPECLEGYRDSVQRFHVEQGSLGPRA